MAKERGFNLLERKISFGQAVTEALAEKAAKRAKGSSKSGMHSRPRDIIPIPELPLAWLVGMEGFVSRSVMSIVGQDRVGKTSLVFTIAGWALRHNSPVCYIETESKPMFEDRIKRCLHSNPMIAQQMFDTINFGQCFTIMDMVEQVEDWVRLIRKPNNQGTYVPLEIPVVVIVDSLSKLMPPKEAQGRSDQVELSEEDKSEKAKKARAKAQRQELDQGSNQEVSKYMHKWSRLLPEFLSHFNVFLILVEHQNQQVDFEGGAMKSFVPQLFKDLENRTKIGGNAINQNATYQITMVPHRTDTVLMRGKPEVCGHFCKMKVVKSSHTTSHRTLSYRISMLPMHDQADSLEPVLNFSPDLGDVLNRSGVLTMRASGKQGLWFCEEFGGGELAYRDLAKAYYARPELHEKVHKSLGLRGEGDKLRAPIINPAVLAVAPPPVAEESEDPAEEELAEEKSVKGKKGKKGRPPGKVKVAAAPPVPVPSVPVPAVLNFSVEEADE